MDYRQAREFIEETNQYGMVYGLDSIRGLMARLGNVQEQLSILHVAGTNGKGSVCAMLAEILQQAGYRTGMYTSPAVFEPEEIIKVNGKMISQEDFAQLAGNVQAACRDMQKEGLPHPTAFEVETAIAFCFFQKEACDYVVLETGLGGAEDATNLITHPVCSIVTSVSRDHMGILGHTLEEIAAAKAGIMKPGCPCVSAAQKPQVLHVLKEAAQRKSSVLCVADSSNIRFSCEEQGWRIVLTEPPDGSCQEQALAVSHKEEVLTLALPGAYQKENAACVLEVIRLLRKKEIRIPKAAVRAGLEQVRLPGRMERIAQGPDFYIDGAHNEGAALLLRETVRDCLAVRRLVYIIGVFADKEYKKVLEIMLPYASRVFTVTPRHPRALDGEELARLACSIRPKLTVTYVPEISQASALAKEAAGEEGVVLAFGSFSYLGELKKAAVQTDDMGRKTGKEESRKKRYG